MPQLKKPTTQKSKQEVEEKPKTKSLASMFESAEPAKAGPPLGRHEALITGVSDLDTDQGLSVSLECIIVNSEENEGRKAFLNYGILKREEVDGEIEETASQGIGYLKRDMELLDHPLVGPENKKDLLKQMQAIADEEPWVNIEVKKKGIYTNVFLQGVQEDQDDKPERPAGY
jgi:hypothetical protein